MAMLSALLLLLTPATPVAPPPPPADHPPAVDRFGDPLPSGALARLGSTRLRLPGPIAGLALSPDHATLIGLSGGVLYFWDTATAERTRDIGGLGIERFALSPDGKALACADAKGGLRLLDVASGKETRRLAGGGKAVNVLVFSPDGKMLAAGEEGAVRLWDVAAAKERGRYEGYEGDVCYLNYSRDGGRVAVGGRTGVCHVLDVSSGKVLFRLADGGGLLSQDGKTIARRGGDSSVTLWDVDSGRELRDFDSHTRVATDPAAFSPDGRVLVTSDGGLMSRLWDVSSGKRIADVPGYAAGFSGDGKVLALFADYNILRLYDVAAGKDLFPEFGPRIPMTRAVFSPDGRTLATVDRSRAQICLWDATTGALRRRLRPEVPDPSVGPPVFSPDGKTLTSFGEGMPRWDPATGDRRPGGPERLPDGDEPVRALSPDGRLALLTTAAGRPCVWDVLAGKGRGKSAGAKDRSAEAALSPDGRLAASVGREDPTGRDFPDDKTATEISVWETSTGRRLCSFGPPPDRPPVGEVRLALDGETLAVALAGGLSLHDARTGRALGRMTADETERRSSGDVHALALSPDGQLLASAGDGGVVSLWETATCKPVRTWKGHDGRVEVLAFSPTGRTLVSAGDDGTGLVWDVAGGRPAERAWTRKEGARLMSDLGGDDPKEADAAVRALAADPDRAIPLLREVVRPAVSKIDPKHVADLIESLATAATADAAEKELSKLDWRAVSALRQAWASDQTPAAVGERIGNLLAQQRSALSPEQRWAIRAIRALEWIATPPARDVLESLANGAEGAVQTDAARAAIRGLPPTPGPAP